MQQRSATDMQQAQPIDLNALISGIEEARPKKEPCNRPATDPATGPQQLQQAVQQPAKAMQQAAERPHAVRYQAPDLLPWDKVNTLEAVRSQFCRIACGMSGAALAGFERAYDHAMLEAFRSPEAERPAIMRAFLQRHERRR